MLGLQLFRHAFKMVFHDFRATVHITLIPLAVGYGLALGLAFFGLGDNFFAVEDGRIPSSAFDASDVVVFMIAIVAMGFAFCWSAVGWHRFALLNEHSGHLVPPFKRALIGSYFWATIRLVVVVIIVVIPLMLLIVLMIINGLVPSGVGQFIPLAVVMVGMFVSYRCALILPAAALGKPISIGSSWKATSGYSGTIIALVVGLILLNSLFTLILNSFLPISFSGLGALGLVPFALVSWLNIILGVSILTTLYGYLIEKRPLD